MHLQERIHHIDGYHPVGIIALSLVNTSILPHIILVLYWLVGLSPAVTWNETPTRTEAIILTIIAGWAVIALLYALRYLRIDTNLYPKLQTLNHPDNRKLFMPAIIAYLNLGILAMAPWAFGYFWLFTNRWLTIAIVIITTLLIIGSSVWVRFDTVRIGQRLQNKTEEQADSFRNAVVEKLNAQRGSTLLYKFTWYDWATELLVYLGLATCLALSIGSVEKLIVTYAITAIAALLRATERMLPRLSAWGKTEKCAIKGSRAIRTVRILMAFGLALLL